MNQGGEASTTAGEGGAVDAGGGGAGSGSELSGGTGGMGEHLPAIGLRVVAQEPFPEDNPDNRLCQVQPNGSRVYVIGAPNGDETVEHGTSNVALTCTVTEAGNVTIDLYAPNQAAGLPGNFGFNWTGVITSSTDAAQNTGTLVFFDPDAGAMVPTETGPLCTMGPPGGGAPLTLLPGALLANFTCPLLSGNGNPREGCRVSGTIAVEYCETVQSEE